MALIRRKLLNRLLLDGYPLQGALNRGTGRTTAAMLEAVISAIRHPGKWHFVQDPSTPDLRCNQESVARSLRDIVARLKLEDIEVKLFDGGSNLRGCRDVDAHSLRAGHQYHIGIKSTFAEEIT